MAGEVEIIAKLLPKNNAFVGIVDANQVLSGTGSFGCYFHSPTASLDVYRYIPFECVLTGWEIVSVVACDIVFDIQKCAAIDMPALATIVGDVPPYLSSATYGTGNDFTNWTTAINAGDVIRFSIFSLTGSPVFVNLDMKYTRTVLG